MTRRRDGQAGLGRRNEPAVLILTSLASGPKHGYALTKDIEDFAHVRLGPGALYGALSRLDERGFVRACAGEDRRRPYEITTRGAAALDQTLRAMDEVVREGTARLRAGVAGGRGRIAPAGATS